MTRLILPVAAAAILLAGMPAWAQDNAADAKAAPAAAGAMKCKMMEEMKMGAMKQEAAPDVVAKLTAKKKELKLNDKQIQQIADALAAPEPNKMGGMKMGGEPKAAGHEAHQH